MFYITGFKILHVPIAWYNPINFIYSKIDIFMVLVNINEYYITLHNDRNSEITIYVWCNIMKEL